MNARALPPLHSAAAPLRAHWQRLAAREQTLVLLAAALVGLALAWWVLLAPALHTWRSSAARHAEVDAQLRHMQQLQAQALQLRDAPRPQGGGAAVAALRASTTQILGAGAQLTAAGEQASVTLKGVPAEALAHWLAQARASAHAVPVQARLTRSAGAVPAWDGTLVLALPPG